MALNATFTADFSSFLDACHKAEVAIKGIDDGAANVTGRLERMANSLSGRSIIQQATLMSEAIARLEGGLASLTPAELQRVGAVATEAAAKFRALGQQVPADIQKIADAAQSASATTVSAFGRLNDSLGKVGLSVQSLTLAGAGAGLARMATDTLAFAGHLNDLSAATGINVTELQRLQFAGQQVGVSLDQVAGGVEKLQKNLVAGDAAGEVAKLGLNVDALRAMDPGDMFEAISRRIAEIPDPAERTATAIALLGKSGADLLPLLTADIDKLAGGYKGMSKEAVDGLDAIGDAWDRLVIRSKAAVGQAITWADKYANSLHRLIPALDEIDKKLNEAMHAPSPYEQLANDIEALGKAAEAVAPKLPNPGKIKPADTSGVEAQNAKLEASFRAADAAAEQYRQAVQQLADELSGAAAAASVGKLAAAVEQLTRRFGGLSSTGLASLAKQLQDLRAKGADVTPILDQMASAQLALSLLYPSTTAGLNKQIESLGTYSFLVKPIPEFVDLLGTKLRSLETILPKASTNFDQLGTRMKAAFGVETRVQLQITADALERAFQEMAASGQFGAKEMEAAAKRMVDAIRRAHGEAVTETTTLGQALTDTGKLFAQMAQIGDGAFPTIARHIGSVATAVGGLMTAMHDLNDPAKGGFNAANLAALAAGWVGVAIVIYQVADALYKAQQAQKKLDAMRDEGFIIASDFGREMTQSFGVELVDAIDKSSNALNALLQSSAGASRYLRQTGQLLSTEQRDTFARFGAEAIHIVDIVKELGGLSASNLGMVEDRVGSLFTIIELGGSEAKKAMDALGAELQELGGYFEQQGGLWDRTFAKMVEDAEQLGGAVGEVATKILAGQTDKATKGLTTFLSAGATAYDTIAKKQTELADLQAQYADASAANAPKLKQQIDETTAAIETQRKVLQATAITTQQGAEAAGAGLFGSFGLMLQQGKSLTDALAAIAPGVTALQTQLDATGLTGGETFAKLQAMVALTSDAVGGPAITAVSGLNDALIGLQNTGILNQDMFAGLADQVGQTYDALIAQGKDGAAALAAMQPTLQTIWELEDKYGYTVDESTQKLVDQAKQQGIVGDEHKSVADQMLEATKKISDAVEGLAHVFGVILPGDMEKATKAATDAGKAMAGAINAVPKSITVGVDYKIGAPPPPGPSATEPEHHAIGGIVGGGGAISAPVLFAPSGTDTVPAMLTPGERVLTVDETKRYNAGGDTYAINLSISAIDGDHLQATVERKVIPLLVDAIRVNRRQSRTDFRSVLGVAPDVLGGA